MLLEKESSKRIGTNGASEIKSHPWFEKVNWNALLNKTIKAPFVPILSSDADSSNFDE
jgi:serum/glucocorticoid-regulated kinase 2